MHSCLSLLLLRHTLLCKCLQIQGCLWEGWASTRSHSVPLFSEEKAEQEPQRAQCPASVHWCQESRAVQRCVNSIAAVGTAPAQKLCQWVVSRLSFPRAGLSDVRKQQAALPS